MYVVLAALLGALGAAQDPGPEHNEIESWIDRLGSDDLDIRDRAHQWLLRRGRAAWPALERLREGPDPALRAAAAEILDRSRRRRGIPHRILREYPSALAILDGPATTEKIRLIRSMSRSFEECEHLLLPLLISSDAESGIAAAEVLSDQRKTEWIEPLLRLLASEDCPRAPRVAELLAAASSRVDRENFRRLLDGAGPLGRARLVEFAVYNLTLEIPRSLLYRMLREVNPRSARAALSWIRSRPLAEDAAPVTELLTSAEPGLVAEAIETLRNLRVWVEPSTVRRLLSHESSAVRSEALELMASLEDPLIAETALRFLGDPSTSVRRTAFLTLWSVRGVGALEITLSIYFEEDGDPRDLAASYLLRHRGWLRPRLLDALESPFTDRRLRAMELLYSLDGIPVAIRAAGDEEDEVRRWALTRLLCHDGPAVSEAIDTLVRDPNESIRFEVLRGLVRRGRSEYAAELARFLDRTEYAYLLGAAETLLDSSGDTTTDHARRILRIQDPSLRRMALEALADRRTLDEVGEALSCLSDPDPRLQRVALHYLSLSVSGKPSPEVAAGVRERLSHFANEDLEQAVLLLASSGDSRSFRDLIRSGRLSSPERVLRLLAERGDADLAELLGDNAELNARVLRAMSGRAAAQEPLKRRLKRLLRHSDPQVRAGALRAPSDVPFADVEAEILSALDDPEAMVRAAAIAACSDRWIVPAAPLLAGLLDDEDPDVRIESARALSRLSPSSKPHVERAARAEDHAWVRTRVEAVLRDWK